MDPEINNIEELIESLQFKPYFVEQDNKFFVNAILFLALELQTLQAQLSLLEYYAHGGEE